LSNIDDILAAAKAKSTDLTPLTPATPLTPMSGGASVVYNMSEDAFLSANGMEVVSYLVVKDAGIKLSKDWQGYIDEFEATIDLSEVALFMGIRKEVGTNVTYAKTYDGVSTHRTGEPFSTTVENFKRDSTKPADVYRGADIPMTVTQDYTDAKSKKTIEAGTRVGLTTSITGFKPWAAFKKKLNDAGFGKSTVRVKVTHSPRTNQNNQEYGVCEFTLLEVIQQESIAA
jgi:hypothetical protein